MDAILFTIVKISKCKPGPFENTQSMSKWPTRSVYIGNTIDYITYLPASFPRGLGIDLEGSSIFPTLILSMLIDRLSLFSQLYRCLFNCITLWQGSWAGTTALYMEVWLCCTIAIIVGCSTPQLPGFECAVKVSYAPLGCLHAIYMGIYGYI